MMGKNINFMKKTIFKNMLIAGVLIASVMVANAQVPISFSGQIGYASPFGGHFENANGEKMSKFGLGVDIDVLYHFEKMDYKLGVGLAYNTSLLFGADLENFSDIGMYGLSLYGVKGHYRFLNSKISPYVALSLGLSHFSTPELTMSDGFDNEIVTEGESAFGFGIRPEIGVEFGGFLLSVAYTVPMSYKVYEESKTAGCLQVNLGWRFSLFERENNSKRRWR